MQSIGNSNGLFHRPASPPASLTPSRRCLGGLLSYKATRVAALRDWFKRSTCGGALQGGACSAIVVQRATGARCGRAGRFHGEGCGRRGAAGRAGGAGRRRDGPPSAPGPCEGRPQAEEQTTGCVVPPRWERSEAGPRPITHGQAEDQAKASWRTRAGAIRGGSAASVRCRRFLESPRPA